MTNKKIHINIGKFNWSLLLKIRNIDQRHFIFMCQHDPLISATSAAFWVHEIIFTYLLCSFDCIYFFNLLLSCITTCRPKSARHTNTDLCFVIHQNQLCNHISSHFFSFSATKVLTNPERSDGCSGRRCLLHLPGHGWPTAQDCVEQEGEESEQPAFWGIRSIVLM